MRTPYEYAVIQAVPRVERGELINAGVIVSCPTQDYLAARIALDAARLRALSPSTDIAEVPDDWLVGPEPPDAMRRGYVEHLRSRLAAPRLFVEEAIRAKLV